MTKYFLTKVSDRTFVVITFTQHGSSKKRNKAKVKEKKPQD